MEGAACSFDRRVYAKPYASSVVLPKSWGTLNDQQMITISRLAGHRLCQSFCW